MREKRGVEENTGQRRWERDRDGERGGREGGGDTDQWGRKSQGNGLGR